MDSEKTHIRFVTGILYLIPGFIFLFKLSTLAQIPLTIILFLSIFLLGCLVTVRSLIPFLDLFLLGFYLVAFNLIYFVDVIIDLPRDTVVYYQIFYVFYNHIFKAGEIPLWFPDVVYGLRSGFVQLGFVSPSSYLLMVLGKVFQIQSVYHLFVGSVIFQQIIYLLGVYIFANSIKLTSLSRFLLCFIAISSLLWYQHYFFELQLIYLFPLQLYCIHQFIATSKPRYILGLALLFTFWLMGSLYLPILGFYVCVLFGVTLALLRYHKFKIAFEEKDYFLSALFLVIFLFLVGSFILFTQDLAFPGRSTDTLSNPQSLVSRSYRESLDHLVINFLDPLDGEIFTRTIFEQNMHVYIGILPVFLLIYALLKGNNQPIFLAAGVTGFFVLWISFNELFTQLTMMLPALNYYRWFGLVYPYVRILLAVAAIYSFNDSVQGKMSIKRTLASLVILAFLLDGALALFHAGKDAEFPRGDLDTFVFRLSIYLIAVSISWLLTKQPVFSRLAGTGTSNLLQYSLAFALVVDLTSYQLVWNSLLPGKQKLWSPETVQAVTGVSPLEYIPQRTLTPRPKTSRGYTIDQAGFFTRFYYPMAYEFGQYDPCIQKGYVQVIEGRSLDVLSLIKKLHADNVDFSERVNVLIACRRPKLRLISNASIDPQIVSSHQLLEEDLTNLVVLADEVAQMPTNSLGRGTERTLDIDVEQFNYNQISLNIDNPYDPGAWLYYSDSYHPYWQATLDNREVPIARANLNFKAVWIPTGRHTLVFRFDNPLLSTVQTSLFILGSLGSILILILVVRTLVRQTLPANHLSEVHKIPHG